VSIELLQGQVWNGTVKWVSQGRAGIALTQAAD
jgi:hypothetical protein